MKTPVSQLNTQQLCLALARHLYPASQVDLQYGTVSVYNGGDSYLVDDFQLDWQTCGPLWEAEADNWLKHWLHKGGFDYGDGEEELEVFSDVHQDGFHASKTPESIARAILAMKYPEGVEIE